MRRLRAILIVASLLGAILLHAANEPASTPLLPKQFAGWQQSATPHISQDPAAADPANAGLLKEYGFTDFESASYTREDGRKLTVKAIRFPDASGAYGAYTYYRSPGMPEEKIGDQAASLNERVLFYRGGVVVDAVFSRTSGMSAAELRELSGMLPKPVTGSPELPAFLSRLPNGSNAKRDVKFIVGPVGLQKMNAPLPPELVDFNKEAEVALQNYSTSQGNATLLLLSYPTKEIAEATLSRITSAYEQNKKQPGSVPALGQDPLFAKRTGSYVVLVSGKVSQGDAQDLLASVNFEANVTMNEKNPFDKRGNIGTIVVNALLLAGTIAVLALIAGLGFGGARVLTKKLFPNTSLGRPDETEFISLHLEEAESKAPDAGVS